MSNDHVTAVRPLRWLAPLGLLVTLFGLVSYFAFFARFPALRDQPWLNLALVVAGGALTVIAFWKRRGFMRGAALLLALAAAGLLFWYVYALSASLPASENAVALGAAAPAFDLLDAGGERLSSEIFQERAFLLVFYRGFW